ncbi:MAG TPA: aldehyde dehydrogenase family protein, partial [Bdellovibrionota bacterium]|nr:aldehyde dehydrogenase family protein [Bdellovibrionota bacterium]
MALEKATQRKKKNGTAKAKGPAPAKGAKGATVEPGSGAQLARSARPNRFVQDYDAAPQEADFARLKDRYELFIGGKFVQPKSGRYLETLNPARETRIAEVADAGEADVDAAVKAARAAYEKTWSKMPGKERAKYLFRIARMIQERARELAVVETMDGGKPIKESRDVDIPLAAAHFFYHAGWADKLEYAFPGAKVAPLGVAGQVIPWNFPLLMAAWKIAPALACGNTVVLKPAETTPLTALLLAEICQAAELPEGVVNIVTGGPDTGKAVVNHGDLNKVAFTGSTAVGKLIAKAVAGTDKRLTLELGGKSAHIIYEDAAIDQAVEGVVNGIFFNQGHVCCAGSRLLVEESIAEVVMRKLKNRMDQLRVGDPLDKNTDIGAINSAAQLKTIQDLVKKAKDEGAEFHQSSRFSLPKKGYFHAPCVFSGVSSASTIFRVEVFGPVLAMSTFRTPAEAVQKANDTPYGL